MCDAISRWDKVVHKMEAESEFDAKIREVHKHFFISPQAERTVAALDATFDMLRPEHHAVAMAFRYSLDATLSTVTVPFTLAISSIQQSHAQRIAAGARIQAEFPDVFPEHASDLSPDGESTDPSEDPETRRERRAQRRFDSEFRKLVESKEGMQTLILDTAKFLLASLKDARMEAATRELLQQGLVLLWSAFEVLCRDTFETLLNSDPLRVQALIDHPTTRKRFEAERLPLGSTYPASF
jgi:hypothetical protein